MSETLGLRLESTVRLQSRQAHRVAATAEAHPTVADDDGDEVSDSKIVHERVPPILEYLTTYHDAGRDQLITTSLGRISISSIRVTVYRVTRPYWIGETCPHYKGPQTCKRNDDHDASKCPSTRSPHDPRKARVTNFRNGNVPKDIVSDELDASEDSLDKHYDPANRRQRAERPWQELNK